MAEGKETLRGKVPVRKLIAKENPHHGGNGKSASNQRRLVACKIESARPDICPNQRQPCAPNEQLQDHHDEQFELNHSRVLGFQPGLPEDPMQTPPCEQARTCLRPELRNGSLAVPNRIDRALS